MNGHESLVSRIHEECVSPASKLGGDILISSMGFKGWGGVPTRQWVGLGFKDVVVKQVFQRPSQEMGWVESRTWIKSLIE